MNKQKGMTIGELVIVVALAMLVMASSAAFAVPWLARESMRSAAYDVQTAIQTARIEAVTRNHDCWFEIWGRIKTMKVIDTLGTATRADDIVLHEFKLGSSVNFASPDASPPITLTRIGPQRYRAVLNSQGVVSDGTGSIQLFGGDRYGRLTLMAAGGIQAERWDGSSWKAGL